MRMKAYKLWIGRDLDLYVAWDVPAGRKTVPTMTGRRPVPQWQRVEVRLPRAYAELDSTRRLLDVLLSRSYKKAKDGRCADKTRAHWVEGNGPNVELILRLLCYPVKWQGRTWSSPTRFYGDQNVDEPATQ